MRDWKMPRQTDFGRLVEFLRKKDQHHSMTDLVRAATVALVLSKINLNFMLISVLLSLDNQLNA